MKTPIDEIYNKYEEFRSCKNKDEHADRFLAWFLCYKDNNLEKEKQAIIEAYKQALFFEYQDTEILKDDDSIKNIEEAAEQYYNQKYNK